MATRGCTCRFTSLDLVGEIRDGVRDRLNRGKNIIRTFPERRKKMATDVIDVRACRHCCCFCGGPKSVELRQEAEVLCCSLRFILINGHSEVCESCGIGRHLRLNCDDHCGEGLQCRRG